MFAKSGYNCGCVPTYKPYLHASKPSPESLLQYSEFSVLFGRTFAVPLTHIPISNTTRSTTSLLSTFMLLTYVTSATKVYAQTANFFDPQMTVVSRVRSHYPSTSAQTPTHCMLMSLMNQPCRLNDILANIGSPCAILNTT